MPITTSTFGISGSVKSRNFVPVRVWKQVRRKRSDSSTSIPVLGTPGFGSVETVPGVGVDVPEELCAVLPVVAGATVEGI